MNGKVYQWRKVDAFVLYVQIDGKWKNIGNG